MAESNHVTATYFTFDKALAKSLKSAQVLTINIYFRNMYYVYVRLLIFRGL